MPTWTVGTSQFGLDRSVETSLAEPTVMSVAGRPWRRKERGALSLPVWTLPTMDQSALCSPRRAMGNRSDVPDSTLEPSVLWRVRQWPGTNEAAQFLFVVLAAMW